MTTSTRRTTAEGRALAYALRRSLVLAAIAMVALDALLGAVGSSPAGLSAAALVLAPGLALAALLPAGLRRHPVALLAAVPALGAAASSTALITLSRAGVPLDAGTIRSALLILTLAGLLLPALEPFERPARWEVAGLLVALAAGVVLEARVIAGSPVPGNDWAKYLLYADEIRRHGSLLIDNPFWMLGVPFREDPGVPALYGAFLLVSGAPTATLAHGIWVFAVLGIGTMFALARTLWGPLAAVLAAVLYAVVPMNQDILGWHGLANVAALSLVPLALLYATALVSRGLALREAIGLALVGIGLAADHRLTLLVAGAAFAVTLAGGLLVGPRRAVWRGAIWTGAAAAVLGAGVAADLVARNRSFGGTQGYQAYLDSKVDLRLVALDLTWPFALAAVAAAGWAAARVRRRPEVGPPIAFLAVVVALAYAWVVHFPLSYLRMAYYLPVVLAPLVAVALTALLPPRRAAIAGAALAAVVAVLSYGRADGVRGFYAFADGPSLRGLDAVAARLHPGEVVVTDRCWSFLATWLLHTRTLPALAPEDIQPKAELRFAREAQAILDGRPAGVRRARRLGVRWLLVDPTCLDPRGRPLEPPLVGEPRYVSRRLVVLEMPSDPRGRT